MIITKTSPEGWEEGRAVCEFIFHCTVGDRSHDDSCLPVFAEGVFDVSNADQRQFNERT